MQIKRSLRSSRAAWTGLLPMILASSLASGGCGIETDGGTGESHVGTTAQPIWNGSADAATPERNFIGRVQLAPPPAMNPSGLGCTGTLITQELFLTASHCTNTGAANALAVLIGADPNVNPEVRPVFGGTDCRSASADCYGAQTGPWTEGSVRTMIGSAVYAGEANIDVALVRLMPPTQANLENAFPQKPHLGALPASGGLGNIAGYGNIGTGLGVNDGPFNPSNALPWPIRQQQTFSAFNYALVGNPVGARIRTFPGDASSPAYTALGPGDSGGPLFLQVDGDLQQVGVAQSAFSPEVVTLVGDPDGSLTAAMNPGPSKDEIFQTTASPFVCPVGQFWDGISSNPSCRDFCPSFGIPPNVVAQVWDAVAQTCVRPCPVGAGWDAANQVCNVAISPATAANFRQTQDFTSNWVNLTSPDVRSWLDANAQDPNRPLRWIGERDYQGACRTDVDSDCDRRYDPIDDCPAIFAAGTLGGFNPADLNAYSDLAAFGAIVHINDRARVLGQNDATRADIAASEQTYVRNDARVGGIINSGSLAWFAHRYSVESLFRASSTVVTAQDNADLSGITSVGASVPEIVLTATFPDTKLADISLEPGQAWTGPGCAPGTACFLPPGVYVGTVSLKDGSVLRLLPGQYFFDNLAMNAGAVLEIDNTGGHTEIYVRSSMHWHDRAHVNSLGGDPFAHLFGVFGDATVNVNGSFSGTLVVPNGSINLSSQPHFGAFYAGKYVALHQGGTIRHRPLVCGT